MELARRIAAAFPDARIEDVPDSRTYVPEDQPQRLAELVAGFAREPADPARRQHDRLALRGLAFLHLRAPRCRSRARPGSVSRTPGATPNAFAP